MNSIKTNITNAKNLAVSHKILCVVLSIALALLLVPTAAISTAKAFASEGDSASTDTAITEGSDEQSTDNNEGGETNKDSEETPATTEEGSTNNAFIETTDVTGSFEGTAVGESSDSNNVYNFNVEYDPSAVVQYSDRIENDMFSIEGSGCTVQVDFHDNDHLVVYSHEDGATRDYITLDTRWNDALTEKVFAYWELDGERLHPGNKTEIEEGYHTLEPVYVQECKIEGHIDASALDNIEKLRVSFRYGPESQISKVFDINTSTNLFDFNLDVRTGRGGELDITSEDGTDFYKAISISRSDIATGYVNLGTITLTQEEKTLELYSSHPYQAKLVDASGDAYNNYNLHFDQSATAILLRTDVAPEVADQSQYDYYINVAKDNLNIQTFKVEFRDGYDLQYFDCYDSATGTHESIFPSLFDYKGGLIDLPNFTENASIGVVSKTTAESKATVGGKVVDSDGNAISGAMALIYDENWDIIGRARSNDQGCINYDYPIDPTTESVELNIEIMHPSYDYTTVVAKGERDQETEELIANFGTVCMTQGEKCVVDAVADTDGGYFKDASTGEDFSYVWTEPLDCSDKTPTYHIDASDTLIVKDVDQSIVLQLTPTPYAANSFIGWNLYNAYGDEIDITPDAYIGDVPLDCGDCTFFAYFEETVLAEGRITDQDDNPVEGANVRLYYSLSSLEEAVLAVSEGRDIEHLDAITDANGDYSFAKPVNFDRQIGGVIVAYLPGYRPTGEVESRFPVQHYVDLKLIDVGDSVPVYGQVSDYGQSEGFSPVKGVDVKYECIDETHTHLTQTTHTGMYGEFFLDGYADHYNGLVTVTDKDGKENYKLLTEENYDDKVGCLVAHINLAEINVLFSAVNGEIYYANSWGTEEGYSSVYSDSFLPGTTVKSTVSTTGYPDVLQFTENPSGEEEGGYGLLVSAASAKPGTKFSHWSVIQDGEESDITTAKSTTIDDGTTSLSFKAHFTIDEDAVVGKVMDSETLEAVQGANVYYIPFTGLESYGLEGLSGQELANKVITSGILTKDLTPTTVTDEDGWYHIADAQPRGVVLIGLDGYYPTGHIAIAGKQITTALVNTHGITPVAGVVLEYNDASQDYESCPNASVHYVCRDGWTVSVNADENGVYFAKGGSDYNCYLRATTDTVPVKTGYAMGTENDYWQELGVQTIAIYINEFALAFLTGDENAGMIDYYQEYTNREGEPTVETDTVSLWSDTFEKDAVVTVDELGGITIEDDYLEKPASTYVCPSPNDGYEFSNWTIYDVATQQETTLTGDTFAIDGSKMLKANFVQTTPDTPVTPASDTTSSNGSLSSASTSDFLPWVIAGIVALAILSAGAIYFARKKQNK